MRTTPLAAPALALLLALAILPGEAAAQDAGVVSTLYGTAWTEANDTVNCGWDLVRTPFVLTHQSTGPVDFAQSTSNGPFQTAEGVARGVSDPAADTLDYLYDEGIENAIRTADQESKELKCLVKGYLVWGAEVLVWTNEPVACYAKSTIACGVPKLVCTATYPAKLIVWAPNPFQPVPDAGPCLPPGPVNCVQTPLSTCYPPAPTRSAPVLP